MTPKALTSVKGVESAAQATNSTANIGNLVEELGESAARAPKNPTALYQKVGSNGEHQKFGITKNPDTRYTSKELGSGQLNTIGRGTRQEMLELERTLHERLPIGPEEAQKFCIQKQIDQGLKPPPYGP